MKRSITVTSLSICLFGGIAAADEISMHFDAFGGHESYRIALDGRLSADSSDEVNYVGGVTAGERLWTNQYGAEVVTYCIQVYESVYVGNEYTFTQTEDLTEVPESPPYPGAMNNAQAGLVEDLYARYIDMQTGLLAEGTGLTNNFDNDTATSAFQLVIWEIVNESITDGSLDMAASELSLDLGAFRADTDNNMEGQMATDLIISSLGVDGWMDTQGHLIGLSNPAHQDQLMVVPLPMPAVLAGIGFAGAIVLRRRLR